MVATSLTIAIGGSGGVFAPSLFMGAMLGTAFGAGATMLFPGAGPAGAYGLVGMGAVFAAAARAPITAVIIIFELTGDYRSSCHSCSRSSRPPAEVCSPETPSTPSSSAAAASTSSAAAAPTSCTNCASATRCNLCQRPFYHYRARRHGGSLRVVMWRRSPSSTLMAAIAGW